MKAINIGAQTTTQATVQLLDLAGVKYCGQELLVIADSADETRRPGEGGR